MEPRLQANEPLSPNTDLPVTNKYTGELACRVALADEAAIDRAIAAAVTAQQPMSALAADERQDVLNHCVARARNYRGMW